MSVTRLSTRTILATVFLTSLASCGSAPEPEVSRAVANPVALWGHRPEARDWTAASLAALDRHGAALVHTVPADIDTYCPGYRTGGPEARKAFWVNFLSALAEHESTWRPDAAGGGGQWLGLLQISPQTARGYGCKAQSAAALKDGEQNLSCAIRIMSVTVPRDGVISQNMRGVAADWGPFRQPGKRSAIQSATRAPAYCRG